MDARIFMFCGVLLGMIPGYILSCFAWRKVLSLRPETERWVLVGVMLSVLIIWLVLSLMFATGQWVHLYR